MSCLAWDHDLVLRLIVLGSQTWDWDFWRKLETKGLTNQVIYDLYVKKIICQNGCQNLSMDFYSPTPLISWNVVFYLLDLKMSDFLSIFLENPVYNENWKRTGTRVRKTLKSWVSNFYTINFASRTRIYDKN